MNGEACVINTDCATIRYEAVCIEGACRPSSLPGGPCDEDFDCDNRLNTFLTITRADLACVDKICEELIEEDEDEYETFVSAVGGSCLTDSDCSYTEDSGFEFPRNLLICYKNKCIPPQPEGAGCESSRSCLAEYASDERQKGGCNEETRTCEIASEEILFGGNCYADW